MVEQTSILDITNEAIDHSAQGANPQWIAEAREAVKALCNRGLQFTTDDVHELMTLVHVETKDKRALGSVMRWAVVNKLIRKTGVYRKSRRANCHAMDIPVWLPTGYKIGS